MRHILKGCHMKKDNMLTKRRISHPFCMQIASYWSETRSSFQQGIHTYPASCPTPALISPEVRSERRFSLLEIATKYKEIQIYTGFEHAFRWDEGGKTIIVRYISNLFDLKGKYNSIWTDSEIHRQGQKILSPRKSSLKLLKEEFTDQYDQTRSTDEPLENYTVFIKIYHIQRRREPVWLLMPC